MRFWSRISAAGGPPALIIAVGCVARPVSPSPLRSGSSVFRLAVIPTWYWWAIAVLMVAFAAAVETRQGLAVGIATAVFVAGVLATTALVVFRAVRRAQPRNDLLGPGGVVAILGFVAVTVGVSLAVSFSLRASGVSYAATIGVSVTAVLLVVGGPMLTRHLKGLMLANRSGSRR